MPRSDGSSVSQFSHTVPGHRVDPSVAAESDDRVDVPNQLWIDRFRCLTGDVDAHREQHLGREGVDRGAGWFPVE